jgi:hypothetical protein
MTTTTSRWWTVILTAVLPLGACADAPGEEEMPPPSAAEVAAAAAEEPTLADIQAIGIPSTAMPMTRLVTAAQPTEEQLMALVELGFMNFVSLSPSTEEGAGWEEGIAADVGIHFTRLPVEGAAGLTRENVLELDRVINEVAEENRATVVYAVNVDEVGAMLALRAHWLEGAAPQAAVELGQRAGLSALEPSVREMMAAPR